MKFLRLFLSLCLTFAIGSQAYSNTCSNLFKADTRTKTTGDVLSEFFSIILNAPNNSKVKVYTKSLRKDGVGSLLLIVSLSESRKERGLKFEFNLNDSSQVSNIHELYVQRSTNKIKFNNSEEPRQNTIVVIESAGQVKTYEIPYSLTSESLKDQDKKGPLVVKYDGRNMIRTSPFRKLEGEIQVSESQVDSSKYTVDFKKEINMMESELDEVSNRAFDLALQLYIHKFKEAPKTPMNTFQILKAVAE